MSVEVPAGRLVASRVADDTAAVLREALDRRLTGYATLEPRDALLGGDAERGVLGFEDGVPTLAYHASGAAGPAALAAVAAPGPCRVEFRAVDAEHLPDDTDLRVPPGMPAERLAGDRDLADRTRRRAGDPDGEGRGSAAAVEAFLEDESKVEAIREAAREEAERRAEEWGFEDAL